MIAFPAERNPNELDLEHSKRDIALVRSLARQGLLSPERMQQLAARLEKVASTGKEERIRVAADKALVTMQVSLLNILHDSASEKSQAATQTVQNQQINIYLPQNGREAIEQNGNGRH